MCSMTRGSVALLLKAVGGGEGITLQVEEWRGKGEGRVMHGEKSVSFCHQMACSNFMVKKLQYVT